MANYGSRRKHRRARRSGRYGDKRPLAAKRQVGKLAVTRDPHAFYYVTKGGAIMETHATKKTRKPAKKAAKKAPKRKAAKRKAAKRK